MTDENAAPAATPEATPTTLAAERGDGTLVVARLGRAEFAVPIALVQEVLRTPLIARVPFPSSRLCGAVSLRGTVLPVLDLGVRLGLRPAERPGQLLVVRASTAAEPVALLVDAVTGVLERGMTDLRPAPPEAAATLPPGWIAGVVRADDRVVTLLDLQPVLGGARQADAAGELATESTGDDG